MKPISKKLAKSIGTILGVDWDKIDLDQFTMGINAEMEHGSEFGAATNVTKNDLFKTGKIALAHLIEIPDYYTRLKKMETEAESELEESITLDIDVGDIVLGGKFKNKRIGRQIGTDDLGQPTINGKSLLKFRIEKQLPKEKRSKKTRELAKESTEGEIMIETKRWQKLAGIITEQVSELDLAKVRKKAQWIKDGPNTPRGWNQVLLDIREMLDGSEVSLRQGVYGKWSDRELEALLDELGEERDPGPNDLRDAGQPLRTRAPAAFEGKEVPNLEAMLKAREEHDKS